MITLDTDDVIEVSDYIGALMMSRKLREPFSRQVSNYDSMASSYEIGEVPSSDSHFGLDDIVIDVPTTLADASMDEMSTSDFQGFSRHHRADQQVWDFLPLKMILRLRH